MEHEASRHDVSAVSDRDGIRVECICGWQVWSPTSAAPASLLAAEHRFGGEHLAEVQAPIPSRDGASWAVGIFVMLVCATVISIYLIWSW